MPSITVDEISRLLRLLSKAIGAATIQRILDGLEVERNGGDIPNTPAFTTAEQLVAEAGALPSMLVDTLLPDHSLFLLSGKPKAGKSFLALDLADAVSRGVPAFGSLGVGRYGPVLYLALEDGHTEIARRLAQRQFARGLHPLFFVHEAFHLTDPLHFARVRERARVIRPSLIIVDTAAEALDIRDWINRSEILAKIAPLRRLARELCTILLVAHNRKADGVMGDEIAGSNALAGAVDGWISAHRAERRENGNRRLFLRVEGRGGVGRELAVEMDHESLKFTLVTPEQLERETLSDRKADFAAKRESQYQTAVLAITALGGRVTIAQLAASMSLSYRVAWSLIREMAADGAVEELAPSEPAGTAGRPAPTYRLSAKNA
jgi:predicted ATP-dependent serine protease